MPTRVMVFGTFDLFHPGHLYLLQSAKKYGDELIVVVARNETVQKVKGHPPVQSEAQRLQQLQVIDCVDRVILGEAGDKYAVIRRLQPQVVCLGYNQQAFVDQLSKLFPQLKIVRLDAFQPERYATTMYRKERMNNH